MSKDRSFASKLAKAAHLSSRHCPECGELYRTLKVVRTVKDETKNSWRFKENFVSICKCNEAEYLS
ncbi:MAG: hypothetical protein GXO75_16795 [Calditrichaeota bacterium]|nr:hypothetical protein [Calditrichota bacterium]